MSTPFWISDATNLILRYIDVGGIITTPTFTSVDPVWVGNGSAFNQNWGIALDAAGAFLYAVEENGGASQNSVIYKIDTSTFALTRVAGSGSHFILGSLPGPALGNIFSDIHMIALDANANIYVADTTNAIVIAINTQATTQTLLGVSIPSGNAAIVAGVQGSAGYSGDGGPATAAQISACYGLAFDGSGNLYIADQTTNTIIRKITTAGVISTVAGIPVTPGFTGDGGVPIVARIHNPLGVAFDASDNLYITDSDNFCVRVVNNQASAQNILNIAVGAGTIQTVVGQGTVAGFSGDGGPAIAALLGNTTSNPIKAPWQSVIDSSGNLIIADTFNLRVRAVGTNGIINTVVGTGTLGNTGDGGPATSARIGQVFGLAIALSVAPAPATIRVIKSTSPSGAIQAFTFRPSWGAPFFLVDGQSNTSGILPPGTYSVSEDSVSGWSTVVSGGNPSNIVLGAGETVTLTFTNTFSASGPICYADGIIPAGAIDGVNSSFTLPNAPNPPGSLILESDTSVLAPGVGFNLSFVLNGAQLTLTYPPKTSLVAWYRFSCGSQIPPLYKLNSSQPFDDNAFTDTPTAINSTYFTYGFVNAAKAAQNPLLGFHRKRFTEIQMNVNGSGQLIVETFPNYILKQDLSYNPYAYVIPPILLQTDPPDDIIRPLNSVGNRVYVMFQTNMVGASFDISKAILIGVMDAYSVVNPNSG